MRQCFNGFFPLLACRTFTFAKTRADLQAPPRTSSSNYDPGWVYHDLLVDPISQAALCLERLLRTDLLSKALRRNAISSSIGRPDSRAPVDHSGLWLRVMQGSIDGGYSLLGTQAAGQAVSLRSTVSAMAMHQRAVLFLKRTPMKVPSKPRLSHS